MPAGPGGKKPRGSKCFRRKISTRNHKSSIWVISAHLSDLEAKIGSKCSYYTSVVMLYSNCSTHDVLAPNEGKKFLMVVRMKIKHTHKNTQACNKCTHTFNKHMYTHIHVHIHTGNIHTHTQTHTAIFRSTNVSTSDLVTEASSMGKYSWETRSSNQSVNF